MKHGYMGGWQPRPRLLDGNMYIGLSTVTMYIGLCTNGTTPISLGRTMQL